MFDKAVYDHMNAQIFPDAALVARVSQKFKTRGDSAPRLHAHTLRKVILVAAVALCFCFAVPALAFNGPNIYQLMYAVSPSIAQFFAPVQESCADQGICMEVVSTYVHGDTAEIYLTMQDLAGDRIDESIDLYDSYDLNIPFDSSGTCKQVDYDAATKTATFLIEISTMNGADIPKRKVTFSLGCFLSHVKKEEDIPLEMDWTMVEADPKTQQLNHPYGGTWINPATNEEMISPQYDKVLCSGASIRTLSDGFEMTGLGYVDGKLHIQLYTPGRMEFDDHGFLSLKDSNGSMIHGDMVYHDFVDEETGHYAPYIDYVFDVSEEALMDYSLYGSFYSAKSRTDGDWRVTFPLTTD